MSTKINFLFSNIKFELPSECLKTQTHRGEPITPYIDLSAKHVASLLKQYVKKKYPNVVCSVASEVYSGGDSARAYLSDGEGRPVSDEIASDVDSFGDLFQEGRFDGMYDIYEYSDDVTVTDNGTPLKGGAKYVFIENRPKFGTTPDIIRSLRELQAGGYVMGVMSLDRAIVEAKRWYKPEAVDKVLRMI